MCSWSVLRLPHPGHPFLCLPRGAMNTPLFTLSLQPEKWNFAQLRTAHEFKQQTSKRWHVKTSIMDLGVNRYPGSSSFVSDRGSCIIAKAWTDLPCKMVLDCLLNMLILYCFCSWWYHHKSRGSLRYGGFFPSEQVMWGLFPFRSDFSLPTPTTQTVILSLLSHPPNKPVFWRGRSFREPLMPIVLQKSFLCPLWEKPLAWVANTSLNLLVLTRELFLCLVVAPTETTGYFVWGRTASMGWRTAQLLQEHLTSSISSGKRH